MRLLACALLVQASLHGSNSFTTHEDAPIVTPEPSLPAEPPVPTPGLSFPPTPLPTPSQPRHAPLLDHERAPPEHRPAPTDAEPNPPLQRLDGAHFGSRPNFVVLLLDDSGFNDLGVTCQTFGASRSRTHAALHQ